MSWPSFSAFMRDRTVRHPALVCPMRVVWREYVAYCVRWGFNPAKAWQFETWLMTEEGVNIKGGGSGRLHRVAVGIGLRQEETEHARDA